MTKSVIPEEIATDNRHSMGDPSFVESIVRALALDVRNALFAGPESPEGNPRELLPKIAEQYRELFYSGNNAYQQTMTPEAQAAWLQEHGIGTKETEPRQIAGCLAVAVIGALTDAMVKHAENRISDRQLQIRLDAAIMECVSLLLGLEQRSE